MQAANKVEADIEAGASERVRARFNARTKAWAMGYAPGGRLTWRLDEFSGALQKWIKAPANVLDLGCGTGHLADFLRGQNYAVTGCDVADDMISHAQQTFGDTTVKWVTLPASWTVLPFYEQSFDAIVSSSVFEFVRDVDTVLCEAARVLKDRGVLIFNVPDPGSFRRKREKWWRRLANVSCFRRVLHVIPRVKRYLTYLELSKNRLPIEDWDRCASAHGFIRLHYVRQPSASRAMVLFAFQILPVAERARR